MSANNVASYVTGMVRGATKSLTIDMGFVLEGTAPWEIPEALLGGLRLRKLDLAAAKRIDTQNELPLRRPEFLPLNPQMEDYLQVGNVTLVHRRLVGTRIQLTSLLPCTCAMGAEHPPLWLAPPAPLQDQAEGTGIAGEGSDDAQPPLTPPQPSPTPDKAGAAPSASAVRMQASTLAGDSKAAATPGSATAFGMRHRTTNSRGQSTASSLTGPAAPQNGGSVPGTPDRPTPFMGAANGQASD